MITGFDKAIAAVIGGLGTIAANWGFDFGLSPDQVAALATVISTVLVWFVPNKATT